MHLLPQHIVLLNGNHLTFPPWLVLPAIPITVVKPWTIYHQRQIDNLQSWNWDINSAWISFNLQKGNASNSQRTLSKNISALSYFSVALPHQKQVTFKVGIDLHEWGGADSSTYLQCTRICFEEIRLWKWIKCKSCLKLGTNGNASWKWAKCILCNNMGKMHDWLIVSSWAKCWHLWQPAFAMTFAKTFAMTFARAFTMTFAMTLKLLL